MKKNNILSYICITLFGIIGVYLLLFAGNVKKYDSETRAYKIEKNETTDSNGTTTYYPIYHFKVNGDEYICEAKYGSSFVPNDNKNKVYYDSKNPNKCTVEYQKSTSIFAGIICILVAILVLYLTIKKPKNDQKEIEINNEINNEINIYEQQVKENIEKASIIIDKIELIYKRIIIGIFIFILLLFTLLDTFIIIQTIKARNYIDTVATLVEKKENEEDRVFDDYIYTFKDKKGNNQEIVVSISKDNIPENEIKIKYDENNPDDFYEEGATFDNKEIIWYIVKVTTIVLLIILFFNKKLLRMIRLSISKN